MPLRRNATRSVSLPSATPRLRTMLLCVNHGANGTMHYYPGFYDILNENVGKCTHIYLYRGWEIVDGFAKYAKLTLMFIKLIMLYKL